MAQRQPSSNFRIVNFQCNQQCTDVVVISVFCGYNHLIRCSVFRSEYGISP